MICQVSKGRWRLVQQVKKEHTINYGHVDICRWIWCNSFFKLLKQFQLWCFLHCSTHVAYWQWHRCQQVSKYLLHVNLCLQGMVQDASKEIVGHWYWNEAFVFAWHFATTSFRSKIHDLLLFAGVLVGAWIIIAVFDEAIRCKHWLKSRPFHRVLLSHWLYWKDALCQWLMQKDSWYCWWMKLSSPSDGSFVSLGGTWALLRYLSCLSFPAPQIISTKYLCRLSDFVPNVAVQILN